MGKGAMVGLKTATKIKITLRNLFTISPGAIGNYVRYKLGPRRAEIHRAGYGPIVGALLVTKRCNLSCPFCIIPPLSKPDEWNRYEADPKKIIRILEHPLAKRVLYFGLSGGEPLMNKNLPEIVRLIRKRGHFCGIVTNGTLLGDHVRELKKNGITLINVSVYDTNIEKLSRILPQVNKIFRCRANKILRQSELERTPEKIEAAIRMSRDSGCYGIYFGNYLPHGTEDAGEVVYEDNVAYSMFRAEMTAQFRGFPIYWPTPMKRVLAPRDKKCRMLWYYLSIDMMGNLGLCCNFSIDHAGAYGNLFAHDDSGRLNTPMKVKMRTTLLADSPEIPAICRNCPIMCDEWVSDY